MLSMMPSIHGKNADACCQGKKEVLPGSYLLSNSQARKTNRVFRAHSCGLQSVCFCPMSGCSQKTLCNCERREALRVAILPAQRCLNNLQRYAYLGYEVKLRSDLR